MNHCYANMGLEVSHHGSGSCCYMAQKKQEPLVVKPDHPVMVSNSKDCRINSAGSDSQQISQDSEKDSESIIYRHI